MLNIAELEVYNELQINNCIPKTLPTYILRLIIFSIVCQDNELIQGIVLKSSTQPYIANWDPEAFSKMYNLKFLIVNFHNIQFPRGLKCLCSSLKLLHWTRCTLEALPIGVKLEELVELKMRHSKIKKIWNESRVSVSVKSLCINSI